MKKIFIPIFIFSLFVNSVFAVEVECGTADAVRTALLAGNDIKLTADVSMTETITIVNENYDVTIDCNGFTFKAPGGKEIGVVAGKTLTIKDGKAGPFDTVNLTTDERCTGTIILLNITLSGEVWLGDHMIYEINVDKSNASVEYEGKAGVNALKTVTAVVYNDKTAHLGTALLKGTKYNSIDSALSNGEGKVVFIPSKLTSDITITKSDILVDMCELESNFKITSNSTGTVTLVNGKQKKDVENSGTGNLVIENGSYEGAITNSGSGTITINGGTYKNDPVDFISDSKVAFYDGTNYSVINNDHSFYFEWAKHAYNQFNACMSSVKDGATVTLWKNYSDSVENTFSKQNVSVNLNGKNLTLDKFTISGGSISITDTAENPGEFSVTNAAISGTSTLTLDGIIKIQKLTLSSNNAIAFGEHFNSSSSIYCYPNVTGVITSGFGNRDLGSTINLTSTAKDYMLIKTKSGELKVTQHKSEF